MLHVDLVTRGELVDLAVRRADIALSIYLPTTPVSIENGPDRLLLKNLARDAGVLMVDAEMDKRRVRSVLTEIDDLLADETFWRFQAKGLAILATPDTIRTYRVATEFSPYFEVSDRFLLKPLMRTMDYFDACYVLALSEGEARLIEVAADLPPTEVEVPGLPKDASSVGRARSLSDSSGDRSTGGEAERVRLRHYCRAIDSAIRSLLVGSDVPLIVAAVSGISDLYRSVNSYPHLAQGRIDGNPETRSAADIAAAARAILDGMHDDYITQWHGLFSERMNLDRASTDVGTIARAATFGAVESLLIDMESDLEGTLDAEGRITSNATDLLMSHDATDEIARRVLLAGGRVLVVRAAEIPNVGSPIAATFRYPL